jgi:DNA-binding NarL/FixJ family response regulator
VHVREHGASRCELSAAERRVLELVAEGRSNEGIAETLVISARTVEAHTRAIMLKLGIKRDAALNRRVVAALWWLEHCSQ